MAKFVNLISTILDELRDNVNLVMAKLIDLVSTILDELGCNVNQTIAKPWEFMR